MLHKYRTLVIDILLLENWLNGISSQSSIPFEDERLFSFLDIFCPSDHWRYFYRKYIRPAKVYEKPTLSERIVYFKNRGYTRHGVTTCMKVSPNTVYKYYYGEYLQTKRYAHDQKVEEILPRWECFKATLPKNVLKE